MANWKKILWIGIPAALALLAAGVILSLIFSPKENESTMTFTIKSDFDSSQTTYIILDSPSVQEIPSKVLPCYSFTMPQGYTQIINAQESANRFSGSHIDEYQTPEGTTLEFRQTYANTSWSFSGTGRFQEMTYGDSPLVCYHGENNCAVFWIHGESVLTFVSEKAMEDAQLLELVNRVDYQTLRQPICSPFAFQQGSLTLISDPKLGSVYDTQSYAITGNPQLPEEIFVYGWAQPPEGFSVNSSRMEQDTGPGSYREAYYRSESGRRETIELFSTVFPCTIFNDIQGKALNDPGLVEEITVNGYPGWYHASKTGAELVFITDYLIVDMLYEGEITQQEMLALAEDLIQKPLE